MASGSRPRTISADSDSSSNWSLINANIKQAQAEWTQAVSWGEDDGTFIDSRESSDSEMISERGGESDATGVIIQNKDASENESENIAAENDSTEIRSEDSKESGADSNTTSEANTFDYSHTSSELEEVITRAIIFDGDDSFGDVVRAYGSMWPEKRRNSVSPASSRSRGWPSRARASLTRQKRYSSAAEGDKNRIEVRATPGAISGLPRRSRQAESALASALVPVAERFFSDALRSRGPITDAKPPQDTKEEYKDLQQRGDRNLGPSRAYRDPPTTILGHNGLSSGSSSQIPMPGRPASGPRNYFEAMCSSITRDLETSSDYFSLARLRHVPHSSPVPSQTPNKLTQRIQSRRDLRLARMRMMQQNRTQLQESQTCARLEAQSRADTVAVEERLTTLELEGLRQRTAHLNSLLYQRQRSWDVSFTTRDWAERSRVEPFLGASSHQASESRPAVSGGAKNRMEMNSSRGSAPALRDYHRCLVEHHRQRRHDIVPPLRPNTPNPDSQRSLVEQTHGTQAGESLSRQQERAPAESSREFGADSGAIIMDQGQDLSNNSRVGMNDGTFCMDGEAEYRQMTRDLAYVWEREEVDTTDKILNAHPSIGLFTTPVQMHPVISPLLVADGHSYWAPLPSDLNATHASKPLDPYASRYHQGPLSYMENPAFNPPPSAIKTHPDGSCWLPFGSSTNTSYGNSYYSQSYSLVSYRSTTTCPSWAPLSWGSNDMSAPTMRPPQPMNTARTAIDSLDLPLPRMTNSNIATVSWSPSPSFGWE